MKNIKVIYGNKETGNIIIGYTVGTQIWYKAYPHWPLVFSSNPKDLFKQGYRELNLEEVLNNA